MSQVADTIQRREYVEARIGKEAGSVAAHQWGRIHKPMLGFMTSTAINRSKRLGLTLVGSLTGALTGFVVAVVAVLFAFALVAAAASPHFSADPSANGEAFKLPLMVLAGIAGIVAGGLGGKDLTRWWLRSS